MVADHDVEMAWTKRRPAREGTVWDDTSGGCCTASTWPQGRLFPRSRHGTNVLTRSGSRRLRRAARRRRRPDPRYAGKVRAPHLDDGTVSRAGGHRARPAMMQLNAGGCDPPDAFTTAASPAKRRRERTLYRYQPPTPCGYGDRQSASETAWCGTRTGTHGSSSRRRLEGESTGPNTTRRGARWRSRPAFEVFTRSRGFPTASRAMRTDCMWLNVLGGGAAGGSRQRTPARRGTSEGREAPPVLSAGPASDTLFITTARRSLRAVGDRAARGAIFALAVEHARNSPRAGGAPDRRQLTGGLRAGIRRAVGPVAALGVTLPAGPVDPVLGDV